MEDCLRFPHADVSHYAYASYNANLKVKIWQLGSNMPGMRRPNSENLKNVSNWQLVRMCACVCVCGCVYRDSRLQLQYFSDCRQGKRAREIVPRQLTGIIVPRQPRRVLLSLALDNIMITLHASI